MIVVITIGAIAALIAAVCGAIVSFDTARKATKNLVVQMHEKKTEAAQVARAVMKGIKH